MVNQAGVLAKNGGNVASYFCTPDGRVIHAVTGPVPAEELLAAARWAVDVSSGGRAVDDPERIGAAHREELQRPSRPVASPAQQKVHRLLASQPLPPLNEVYQHGLRRYPGPARQSAGYRAGTGRAGLCGRPACQAAGVAHPAQETRQPGGPR